MMNERISMIIISLYFNLFYFIEWYWHFTFPFLIMFALVFELLITNEIWQSPLPLGILSFLVWPSYPSYNSNSRRRRRNIMWLDDESNSPSIPTLKIRWRTPMSVSTKVSFDRIGPEPNSKPFASAYNRSAMTDFGHWRSSLLNLLIDFMYCISVHSTWRTIP